MPLDNFIKENEEVIKRVASGSIISLMASLIMALLDSKSPFIVVVRIFIAGSLIGTLIAFIFRNSPNSPARDIIIACFSAYVTFAVLAIKKKFLEWINKQDK